MACGLSEHYRHFFELTRLNETITIVDSEDAALGVQVHRYLRVSNARRRQQTKFVVLGFSVTLLGNIVYGDRAARTFPGAQRAGIALFVDWLPNLSGYHAHPAYLVRHRYSAVPAF